MKRKLAEILAKYYANKYNTIVYVGAIDLARFDREHYYYHAIIALVGHPTLYACGDININTGEIFPTEQYWRGEII